MKYRVKLIKEEQIEDQIIKREVETKKFDDNFSG